MNSDQIAAGLLDLFKNDICWVRFLAEQEREAFQMQGRYDGAMSEQCKQAFKAKQKTIAELRQAIK